ncbi:YwqJ-related putative deaminase [Kitasatospora sp. NPDC004531]
MPQPRDPDGTLSWLAGCGWSPSRDIGERARELLADWVRADGGQAGEESAALSFLGRFGDLTLPTASGGVLRTVPTAPAGPESAAALAELAAALGEPVVPVGAELDGPGRLVVSAGGSFFHLGADEVEFLGVNPYEALDRYRPAAEAEVPHTVSTLLVDRTLWTRSNTLGEQDPELHPAVQEFLDELPPYQREPFAARCAETGLISDVLHHLDEQRADGAETTLEDARPHFAESWISSIAVRPDDSAEHGAPVPPCRSCAALLAELGVEVVEGGRR